jgi:hypothetical protein
MRVGKMSRASSVFKENDEKGKISSWIEKESARN